MGYLKPLLDPKKDAEELGRYDERLKVIGSKPRRVTPVLVPLGNDTSLGALIDGTARVAFDLDGRAPHACAWDWVTPAAGILVYDPDGRGNVRSGLQLFGSVSWWVFWADGYQALAALDDDGDGWLRGPELAGIAVWRDANGDAVSGAGEVRPLTALGITGLEVRPAVDPASGALTARVERDGHVVPSYDWEARCR